jgi:hypothetical protein
MKILIALPEHNYYLWQMLVQINNLKKVGYDKDTIYVIGRSNITRNKNLDNIIKKTGSKCTFHTYKDDRSNLTYSPSLTAHLLSKLFKDHPEYKNETFLYIDPDVIFKKKIRFTDLEKNDTWYLSDTRSYINSKYIKSKGDGLLEEMCDVVGIDSKIVEENDNNAGGAQILLKNVDSEFWDKVEDDSINLFKLMKDTENKYTPDAPIQAWTAEMWSVLWNAWLFGHETKIIKRLNFCWASDPISKWDNCNIFHNAGVTSSFSDEFFKKTLYQKSPFNEKLTSSKKYCSKIYIDEIKETKKNFKNILF